MGFMDDAKKMAEDAVNGAKDATSDPGGALDAAKGMADQVLDKVEDAGLVDKIPGNMDNELLDKARTVIEDNDEVTE